jgi:hypothetical protein
MKPFIPVMLITASLMSCNSPVHENPPADKTPDTISAVDKTASLPKTSDENLMVVNKFFTAIANQDTAAMSSVMADDYKGYGPSIGDSSAGKHEYLSNWKYNFDHFFASIKYERSQNIASTIGENNAAEPGEWVSNWSYGSIKYRDGKGPIHIWVNSVFKIDQGKIVKCRVFYNEADWLRQLGYQLVHSGNSTHL